MRLLLLTALLLAPLVALQAADAPKPGAVAKPVLYVAPDGSDRNSGGIDSPFASLDRARDELRRLKAADGLKEGGTVYLRGGRYCLTQSFKLDSKDGGGTNAPVRYEAWQGETPILMGARPVRGFSPYEGAILQADTRAAGLTNTRLRQLLFEGRRQPLARYPNFDPTDPHGGTWAYVDGQVIPMHQDFKDLNLPTQRAWNQSVFLSRPAALATLHYKETDARPWAHPEQAEVFVFPRFNWVNDILPVTGRDSSQRLLTLGKPASYEIRAGDRYFVRNVFEELDAPGEWWFDEQEAKLFFQPPAGPPARLADLAVYAVTLPNIIEVTGAACLEFRGLTFEGSEGTALVLRSATNCLVAKCTFRAVGEFAGDAIAVEGGTGNAVRGNDISAVGRNGITISGGDSARLIPAGNVAENNHIHHVGVLCRHGSGIEVSGVGNRVSHNLIHDGPRKGILFRGNLHLIEFNRIHHVNLETQDTGAIGTSGRNWLDSRGTVVRYNFISDCPGPWQCNGEWTEQYGEWGIYLDDNTSGVDVIGNIVARSGKTGIHLHNARDNLIENNIFIDAGADQVRYSGWTTSSRYWVNISGHMAETHERAIREPAWQALRGMGVSPRQAVLPDGTIMANNVVRRNIFSFRAPDARFVSTRNFSFSNNTSDYNLVYSYGRPIGTGVTASKGATGPNLAPNPDFEELAPEAGTKRPEAEVLPARWSWSMRPQGAQAGTDALLPFAGQRSLRITGAFGPDATGRDTHPIIISDPIPAQPGQAFVLTGRIRSDKPVASVKLGVQAVEKNTFFWLDQNLAKAGPEWKQFEMTFQVPVKGQRGFHPRLNRINVRIDLLESDGHLWVDDLSLQAATLMDEWEAWRKHGMDRHSVVADPGFVAPEKDDYRLRPDSPAFKLGFKPIPFEQIGCYASPDRATWPIAGERAP